jgi:deoxyribodipyrimidine photo-lyase
MHSSILHSSAQQILHRFVYTRSRTAQLGPADPLTPGAEVDSKHSRLLSYADGRNRADRDTSSRISPYLATGVLSVRECIREVLKLTGKKTVDGGKDTGVGNWIQELAWRDFYSHLMVAFPRSVCS